MIRIGQRPLRDDPRWRRWAPVGESWSEPAAGTYRPAKNPSDWAELRYRHVVPDPEQWRAIEQRPGADGRPTADLDHRFLFL